MKTIVVYFSWSGKTEIVAQRLAQKTHAELFRIERQVPYSTDYNTCAMQEAKPEWERQARPPIRQPLPELEGFDAVLLAFPIWWYTFPMPVASFLESYADWRKKKLFVFATSYSDVSSQFTAAINDAKASAHNAVVLPGLYNDEISKLDVWLRAHGF